MFNAPSQEQHCRAGVDAACAWRQRCCLSRVDIIPKVTRRLWVLFAFVIPGLAIAATAILAGQLGLDPSIGWGSRRIALAIVGACTTLFGALYWRYTDATLKMLSRVKSSIETYAIGLHISLPQGAADLLGSFRKYWLVFPILILVIVIYVWLSSSGTVTTWVSPTHYYADLARGFLRGHFYLRTHEPGTDYSYYRGRYYLYFGPVPALLLLLVHPMAPWRIGDLQLVFAFVTGTFVVQCLLALLIWDHFLGKLPKYLLWSSILLTGLASPTTFILNNHIGGRVYEAAISGGQFFLMSGMLAAATTVGRPSSHWRLLLAGTLWSLAIGTRINLALPIGFMVLVVSSRILASTHPLSRKIGELGFLSLPVAVGLACLGWYNWARFGSTLETGFSYQTDTALATGRQFFDAIRPVFILQNLWSYLLTPFDIGAQFPWLFAKSASATAIFGWYSLPELYGAQTLTGLLYTVPFVLFAMIPLARLVNRTFGRKAAGIPLHNHELHLLDWTALTLSGAWLAAFGFLLTYYWVAERFLEDVMPSWIMLSVIGFWQGYSYLSHRPPWEKWFAVLGIVLAATSIVASTLVAISVNEARFALIHLFSFRP